MISGFWQQLNTPIMALAPMADVTDAAFRRIIAKYGKPDVTWTEFVSADGLFLGGRDSLMRDLWFDESERPIVAQFFSPDPSRMKQAAELAVELGFDGIDLNMGCPDSSVCKQGAGSAMIRTPELAQDVVRATMDGAGELPVSVKTRSGYSSDRELDAWMSALIETQPAAITVHARTKKDMSKVPARWELLPRVVELRDQHSPDTRILGNGDVSSLEEAHRRVEETGVDGVMIGRGIFGNPWFFNTDSDASTVTIEEKLRVLVEHTRLFEELLGNEKSFYLMKKHFKAYVSGWEGAKELRGKLMEAEDADDVEQTINTYLTRKTEKNT
ncbi:MAG: tRNA-dihydrouridine synthase [Candidatus Paceibacterota bacterium]